MSKRRTSLDLSTVGYALSGGRTRWPANRGTRPRPDRLHRLLERQHIYAASNAKNRRCGWSPIRPAGQGVRLALGIAQSSMFAGVLTNQEGPSGIHDALGQTGSSANPEGGTYHTADNLPTARNSYRWTRLKLSITRGPIPSGCDTRGFGGPVPPVVRQHKTSTIRRAGGEGEGGDLLRLVAPGRLKGLTRRGPPQPQAAALTGGKGRAGRRPGRQGRRTGA